MSEGARTDAELADARVHVDYNGNVFYWRYKNTKVADPIKSAEPFLWLTCPPEKYLGDQEQT